MSAAALVGWVGVAAGIGGLIAYFAIVFRQPKTVRMLNGAGLLFTSLALFQSRMLTALAQGPLAVGVEIAVGLLVVSVLAQAMAGWRNRTAWDGVERRMSPRWDGVDRRGATSGESTA